MIRAQLVCAWNIAGGDEEEQQLKVTVEVVKVVKAAGNSFHYLQHHMADCQPLPCSLGSLT